MVSRILDSDPLLAGVSFLWIIFVIGVGESFRRFGRYPPDLTRKIIHVGVGAWALPTALLFDSPLWAALCPAVFILLNTLSYRFRLMDVIEEEGSGTPGTIYFPISFVALILVLWPMEGRAASVAGLYAMAFGDASASVLGRRWGRHPYRVAGSEKTWEGTAAMLVVSFLFVLVGTWPLLDHPAWLAAAGAAVVAAAVEAPAGRGLDNLTVPILAGGAFFLLRGLFG